MLNTVTILFEDQHLFIINKPPLVHSVSQTASDDSVARRLINDAPGLATVANREGDGGLINRLDFETSGILIAAKSSEVWAVLREQFASHEIRKKYLALVQGNPSTPLVISGYIGSRHRGSTKVTFQQEERKRFLFTRSEILQTVWHNSATHESLIEVETTTGARHQVRAHCAAAGHPLIGDVLYGSEKKVEFPDAPSFILHAQRVQLFHPVSKEQVTFEAPWPLYLTKS